MFVEKYACLVLLLIKHFASWHFRESNDCNRNNQYLIWYCYCYFFEYHCVHDTMNICKVDGEVVFFLLRASTSNEAKVKMIYNSIYFIIWHCENECIFLEEIKRICHKNVSFCMPLKFHTFPYGISQNVTYLYTVCVCVCAWLLRVQRNVNAIKVIVFENEPYHSVSFSFVFFCLPRSSHLVFVRQFNFMPFLMQ